MLIINQVKYIKRQFKIVQIFKLYSGGGDKRILEVKTDFKERAKPKVGSKDNMTHQPGNNEKHIKIYCLIPLTTFFELFFLQAVGMSRYVNKLITISATMIWYCIE